MSTNSFVTRYGDKIDFVDGYYDLFSDLVAQYRDVIQIYDDFSTYLKQRGQDPRQGKTPPVQGAAYLARHARTAKMLEMLDKYGVSRRFDSVLDIGTGYGIMPRLMKAYGLVHEAFGLDLADRTYFISSREILENERALAWTRRVDAVKRRLGAVTPLAFEPIDWARMLRDLVPRRGARERPAVQAGRVHRRSPNEPRLPRLREEGQANGPPHRFGLHPEIQRSTRRLRLVHVDGASCTEAAARPHDRRDDRCRDLVRAAAAPPPAEEGDQARRSVAPPVAVRVAARAGRFRSGATGSKGALPSYPGTERTLA